MVRKVFAVLALLIFSLAGAIPVYAHGDQNDSPGAVYVLTNNPAGNQVVAYNRFADGRLEFQARYDTGGLGSGAGVTVPVDPLGSQNALLLSRDNHWLFAVNAGSNEVSVFSVASTGLTLTDKVSSGGEYPVSLAYRDGLLYVLNAAGDGSINGFRLSDEGRLSPVDGAQQSLHAATPADGTQPQILESPAQVGFTPDGGFLVVTDKGGVSGKGRILVFHLSGGVPDAEPVIRVTEDPVPFAFAFDQQGRLVVASAGMSTVSTYAITDHGKLRAISSLTTGQKATCWIAFNGKYLFTDNTGSNTISALRTDNRGGLRLLNPIAADTGAGTAPLDLGTSKDGKFLYTLEAAAGAIGAYQVGSNGSLSPLETTVITSANSGMQGIAVR